MTTLLRTFAASCDLPSASCLLISPSGSKILVNCGEGMQRALLEHRQHLKSISKIVLCDLDGRYQGGLPGMLLTIQDSLKSASLQIAGKSFPPSSKNKSLKIATNNNDYETEVNIEIIGPRGTKSLISSFRHFMRQDYIQNLLVHEESYGTVFSKKKRLNGGKKKKKDKDKVDEDFHIQTIPLRYEVETSCSNCDVNVHDKNHQDDSSTPKSKRSRIQKNSIQRQCISYIFTTPRIQGKFDIEAAKKLGIPRGPLYRKLKNGESVTFVNGEGDEKTVESSEVVAPGLEGVAVGVLYCPTIDVLDQLMNVNELIELKQQHESGSSSTIVIDCIIHMSPHEVFHDVKYQQWLHTFGSGIEHIHLASYDDKSECHDLSPFHSAQKGALSRSLFDNDIFPFRNTREIIDDKVNNPADVSNNSQALTKGQNLLECILIPRGKKGLKTECIQKPISIDDLKEIKEKVLCSGAKEALTDTNNNTLTLESSSYSELTFTGTGSAIPCKHRNVTGKLMRMSNGNSMLLDCGEGTVGQLLRLYSPTCDRIRNITAAWISHAHADHFLGLIRLLEERVNYNTAKQIIVVAPRAVLSFLYEYSTFVNPRVKGSYVPVDCGNLVAFDDGKIRDNDAHRSSVEIFKKAQLGVNNIVSVPVLHCAHAYALVMDTEDSFGKVVWSGDCRPSDRLVNTVLSLFPEGADLLIHEATFEDDKQEDAVLKRHSTVSEALSVGKRMNAKFTALTHFSQRYPKIPNINVENREDPQVLFAFDFMRVRPSNLQRAAQMLEPLHKFYDFMAESLIKEDADDDVIGGFTSRGDSTSILSQPGAFANSDLL